MTNEWDEYAGDWDSDEEVVQYSEKAYQSLLSVVSLEGLRVLDFGCGTGRLTERLAQSSANVVGLDTSPAMLAVLERKQLPHVSTVEFVLTEELVGNCPLLAPRFDLIVASSVCAFLDNYEGTLSLLKSLLVSGGLFVQWDWLSEVEGGGHGFTHEAVSGALARAGFADVSVTSVFSMAGPSDDMNVLMGVGRNT
jgi:predicted TPR repeat methyltransferase